MKEEREKKRIDDTNVAIEREMIVNGVRIRIKSVFIDKISLDAAWERIIARKIVDEKTT